MNWFRRIFPEKEYSRFIIRVYTQEASGPSHVRETPGPPRKDSGIKLVLPELWVKSRRNEDG